MHFISIALLSVSANLDTFVVAVTYGMRKIKIKFTSALLISVITSAGTFLSMSVGFAINRFMPAFVSNMIGSVILLGLGIWFLAGSFNKKEEKQEQENNKSQIDLNELLQSPEKADMDRSGCIDFKEAAFLACALTMNNIGLGIGASVAGLNIGGTAAATFIINVVFIMLGHRIGNGLISDFLSRNAALISAIVVILMAVYEVFI